MISVPYLARQTSAVTPRHSSAVRGKPGSATRQRAKRSPTAPVTLVLLAVIALAPYARADSPEVAVEEAIGQLASESSATREKGVADAERCLRERPAGPGAIVRLRETARHRSVEVRTALATLLAAVDDPETDRLWVERLDPAEDDRVLAAALPPGLERAPAGAAERALLAALERERPPPARRALLLEALGACRGPAAALVLSTQRPGADWLEESGRALGLGRLGGRAAMPPLLDLLAHADPAPRTHAWESLVRLTRKNLRPERALWAAWWAERAKAGLPPEPGGAAPAAGAAAAPDADPYAAPVPAHVPTYYGIPIPRPHARVVFCIDVSQSMWGEGITKARAHLSRTLKELPSTAAFEIVCFHERVMPWADRLVRAHPVQKARAIAFLAAQEAVSFTNLHDAIETAFSYAGRGRRPVPDPHPLDAVFVLSDGAPNRGRYVEADQVLEAVVALAAGVAPVHAVGAGESAFPLLRRIAAATGGRFVDAYDFD